MPSEIRETIVVSSHYSRPLSKSPPPAAHKTHEPSIATTMTCDTPCKASFTNSASQPDNRQMFLSGFALKRLFLPDKYEARTRLTETRLNGGKGQTLPPNRQEGEMARNYTKNLTTQSVTTRRNAVAILAVAPLAAAISVSPAP